MLFVLSLALCFDAPVRLGVSRKGSCLAAEASVFTPATPAAYFYKLLGHKGLQDKLIVDNDRLNAYNRLRLMVGNGFLSSLGGPSAKDSV